MRNKFAKLIFSVFLASCIVSELRDNPDDLKNNNNSDGSGVGAPPAPAGLTASLVQEGESKIVVLSWTFAGSRDHLQTYEVDRFIATDPEIICSQTSEAAPRAAGFVASAETECDWQMIWAINATNRDAAKDDQHRDQLGSAVTAGTYHYRVRAVYGPPKSFGPYSGEATVVIAGTTGSGTPLLATLLAAGWNHTCAALTSGGVKCWGSNSDGQLGDGSTVSESATPVPVFGLTAIDQLVSGGRHSCIRQTTGVKCWGANDFGQMADAGNSDAHRIPVSVVGLEAHKLGSGSDHVCIVDAGDNNSIICWGKNTNGQVNGTAGGAVYVPVAMTGLSIGAFDDVQGGDGHTCVHKSGGMECWGAGGRGQLGQNNTNSSGTPVSPFGGISPLRMAIGANFNCILHDTGIYDEVRCWGANTAGESGNENLLDVLQPPNGSLWSSASSPTFIAAGKSHGCMYGDILKCWGDNQSKQLGRTTSGAVDAVPVAIDWSPPASVTQIVAGAGHTCVLLSDSTVWCWGGNANGQIGVSPIGGNLDATQVMDDTGESSPE